MSTPKSGFVVYDGMRHRILGIVRSSCDTFDLMRIRPFRGADRMVRADEAQPWKRRTGHRVAKGQTPHRGRPLIIELDTHAESVQVRQKGRRKRLTCTFGGLYDLLVRQEVSNAKSDRAFKRRVRSKGKV